MLKNSEKSKKKPFYGKNKQLHAWMPESLYKWFTEYLDKHSYGTSFSEGRSSMLPMEPQVFLIRC